MNLRCELRTARTNLKLDVHIYLTTCARSVCDWGWEQRKPDRARFHHLSSAWSIRECPFCTRLLSSFESTFLNQTSTPLKVLQVGKVKNTEPSSQNQIKKRRSPYVSLCIVADMQFM